MKDKFRQIDVNDNGFLDDHEFEDAFMKLKNEIQELDEKFPNINEK